MFSIDSLTSEEFSWKAALSLALASELAYKDSATVESVATGQWGFANAKFFDVDDTQVFVALSSDVALVAFRGTESLGDWFRNLNFLSTDRPYGDVHKGFFEAFEVVRQKVTDALGPSDLGGRKLWVTGHSLGGALAVIAAAEFKGTYPVTGLQTFGQPRVGFSSFKSFMNTEYANRFFRFVNDDDIVPKVPPGYSHAGTLIHFDSSGDVKPASRDLAGPDAETEESVLTEEQFKELQDQIREFEAAGAKLEAETFAEGTRSLMSPDASEIASRGFFPSFSDHSLVKYIAAIQRQIDNGG